MQRHLEEPSIVEQLLLRGAQIEKRPPTSVEVGQLVHEIFKGLHLMQPNAVLICAAVVVDFCATMSAANAQKGT